MINDATARPIQAIQANRYDVAAWAALYRATSRHSDYTLLPLVESFVEDIFRDQVGVLDLERLAVTSEGFSPLMAAITASARWLLGWSDKGAGVCLLACSSVRPVHEIDEHMIDPRLFSHFMRPEGKRDAAYTKMTKQIKRTVDNGGLAVALNDCVLLAIGSSRLGMVGGAMCAAPGLVHTQGKDNWTSREYTIAAETRFGAFVSMFSAARIARGALWSQAYRETFRPAPSGIIHMLLTNDDPEMLARDKAHAEEWPIEKAQRMTWGVGLDITLSDGGDGAFAGVTDGAVTLAAVEMLRAELAPWIVEAQEVSGRVVLSVCTDPGATGAHAALVTGDGE